MTFELKAYGPMEGRTVVVTGGTNGIGYEAARALSAAGANVVIVARSAERTKAAADLIGVLTGNAVQTAVADFSDLAQVRAVAAELLSRFPRIDVLANNAGGIFPARQVTVDGFEMTRQVDYLAPFLLTNLLKPALAAAAPSRVIAVSSNAHQGAWRGLNFDDPDGEKSWSSFGSYAAAKLADIMFASELARRWEPLRVTSNSMHPGIVRTGFGRSGDWGEHGLWSLTNLWAITPEQGADTLVYLASSPEVDGVTGEYFFKRAPKRPTDPARDVEAQGRLWRETAQLLGVGADDDS
jgi:NAD(P)-dependent dehydrogenase (short-subunit alcohol dehydrogenase family)